MRHIALALLLASVPAAGFAATVLPTNNSFESPNVSGTNNGVDYMAFDASNGSASTGWTFTTGMVGGNASGYSGISTNSSALFSPTPYGNQVAFIQNNSGFNEQVSGLTLGDSYKISFVDADRYTAGSGAQVNPFTVTFSALNAPGGLLGTFTPTGTTFLQQTSGVYTATATSGLLTFTGTITSGDQSVGIDNIVLTDVTAVPEPASLLLLAGGLVGVGLVRRAQRQRAA